MSTDGIQYEYLSCAVNRTSHVADWLQIQRDGKNYDVYVFGGHKGLMSCSQPEKIDSPAVQMHPTSFKEEIYVLKGLSRQNNNPALLLGSYSGALEIWYPSWQDDALNWTLGIHLPKAHAASITALGTVRDTQSLQRAGNLFVTGSTDCTLKIWHLAEEQNKEASLQQEISLGNKYPLDIALVQLPTSDTVSVTLIAVALTDKKVHIYAKELNGFALKLSLEGHEDWVRAMDFAVAPSAQGESLDVHLASASQDNNIRLWRIQAESVAEVEPAPTDAFEAMARELVPSDDQMINTKKNWLAFDSIPQRWAISLDAVLMGHDAWVTGVRWHPTKRAQDQKAALLTSSMDNSMIVWSPTELSSTKFPLLSDENASRALWLPALRLGDVGSLSGGFLDACWHPTGHAVLTHDRQGASHLWMSDEQTQRYTAQTVITGHAGPARGIAWEPYGDYFLSTGADRTTRLHGTYQEPNSAQDTVPLRSWHEIARPQTHGYELQAVAWLNRTKFVSAADEKVLRVFGAPRAFVESAKALHLIQQHTYRTHLIAADLCNAEDWLHVDRLDGCIESAMQPQPQSVAILACSDGLFDDSRSVPLNYIEYFLQQIYTKTWNIATQQDRLRTEINVYLIPGTSHTNKGRTAIDRWIAAYGRGVTAAWILGQDFELGVLQRLSTPAIQRIDFSPSSASRMENSVPLRTQHTVALGGTFDHLHIGHKLLLSIAALCATRRLIVGVTSDELLVNKKHRHFVEPIAERLCAVRRFVRAFRTPFSPLELDVVPISDVCGPAGTDPELNLLVVTEETAKGADTIAEARQKNCVKAVDVHVVSLVNAAASTDKVGSTAIRGWLESKGMDPSDARPLDMDYQQILAEAPSSAGVPALGLSNRASDTMEANDQSQAIQPCIIPPNPEQLQKETLWLELEKLYGHGYEVLSVDVDSAGCLIASTCKATLPTHAVVRLYDAMERYKPLPDVLEGHTLSVTRVRFSPDRRFILTSSRDRSWRLYERTRDTFVPYAGERAHARIVWDCDWSWDGQFFATASRDKTVKVWRLGDVDGHRYDAVTTITLDDAAMSVAFGNQNRLAIGLERGDVLIYSANEERTSWTCSIALPRHHTGAVNQLAFRPNGAWQDVYNVVPYMLLSCGTDGCVRLISSRN
ncbi:Elongator subunit elp2 [Malassezia yamatoensis]|uniref:Elongator complex protein 2 n=1 Tax=Malassezia yamatoensis TaxID=253288 RepID=A0AAJ5YZQ1_9BASI|nr:Elongator subunit elp2 [Malassezia yamatoensis]